MTTQTNTIVFEPNSPVDAFWCGKWHRGATVIRNAKGGKFRVRWDEGTVSTVDDIRRPRKMKGEPQLTLFAGQHIVFTGSLGDMTRAQAEAKARRHGAVIGRVVTNKTTLVVVGDEPGAKLVKAEELGVKRLPAAKFLRQIAA